MTKSAKELLDCNLGKFTTLRVELLKTAAKETGCHIPAIWSSNKCYAQLEADGLVTMGNDVTSNWQRHWVITEAGRAHLKDRMASSETPSNG